MAQVNPRKVQVKKQITMAAEKMDSSISKHYLTIIFWTPGTANI